MQERPRLKTRLAKRRQGELKKARSQNATKIAGELASKLTSRELRIVVLVAQGYATKNIAHKLQISEWTVATYLRRIFAKLGVDSRAAIDALR